MFIYQSSRQLIRWKVGGASQSFNYWGAQNSSLKYVISSWKDLWKVFSFDSSVTVTLSVDKIRWRYYHWFVGTKIDISNGVTFPWHLLITIFSNLTLLVLEMEYFGFGVNIMPADALAPKVTRASAGMVLAVQDRTLYCCPRVTWIKAYPRYNLKCEYILFYILWINSACKSFDIKGLSYLLTFWH